MNNAEISNVLNETALALEYCNESRFIVDEFFKASERVLALDVPLEQFANASKSRKGEENLEETLRVWFGDVCRDVVWNLGRLIATGSLPLRERLASSVSSSAFAMLRLKTLDPATVLFLREEMNVRDVAALKTAASRGALSRSERFSPEEEREILDEIQRLEARRDASEPQEASSDAALLASRVEPELKIDDPDLMFGANADALAEAIVQMLASEESRNSASARRSPRVDESDAFESGPPRAATLKKRGVLENVRRFFAGRSKPSPRRFSSASSRQEGVVGASGAAPWSRIEKVGAVARFQDCVSRLDFLIETSDPAAAFERVKRAEFVRTVLREEPLLLSVELRGDLFQLPYNDRPTPNATLNFYAATNLTFGTRRLLLTSTPEHWRALRERAAKRDWNLTAFGLYSGSTRLTSRLAERIYEKLETPFVPPELREGRAERDWIAAGTPELLTLNDLRGDLHLHSRFTDGVDEIEAIVAAARRLGLGYVALTDHTQNVGSVGGMNDAEFLHYWDYIDELNDNLARSGVDFRVLKGAEVDILDDGALDLRDETLARADWIVASVHFGLNDPPEKLRDRYSRATSDRCVDVVAHPTERMIGVRAPMNVDVDFLCALAAKHGKFLELNAQPRRLDLNVDGLIAAKKAGVPIVVSTDSHSTAQMEYLRFGVEQCRRAGLTKNDVANALPLNDLLRLRDARRARAFPTSNVADGAARSTSRQDSDFT